MLKIVKPVSGKKSSLKKLNINFLLISEQALYQRGKYKVVLKCVAIIHMLDSIIISSISLEIFKKN